MRYDIAFYILLAITYLFMLVVISDTDKEDGADYVLAFITVIFAPVSLFVISVSVFIDIIKKEVRE